MCLLNKSTKLIRKTIYAEERKNAYVQCINILHLPKGLHIKKHRKGVICSVLKSTLLTKGTAYAEERKSVICSVHMLRSFCRKQKTNKSCVRQDW